MSGRLRQRGVAAVVFLAIFAIILISVLTTAFGGRSVQNEFDAKTLPVLAAAKEALIAYAASHPTAPGRLPCPDTQNDGLEHCSFGDQLGRLPWKTLGIPIPRDGSGECLWYAVSGNFVTTPLTSPINSDANGTIKVVDDASPPNVLAGATVKSLAVAVIFAPGPPFQTNDRTPSAPSQCGGNNISSNYLDTAGGVNNANIALPAQYVAGTPGPTFNDRLVYITPADLFPSVERRVAGEIKKRLQTYFASNGYYPYPSTILDTTNFACTQYITRGRLPETIHSTCSDNLDWPAGALPTWYHNDGWDMLTFYSIAPSYCASPASCLPVGGLLTLQNGPVPLNNKQALVIEAGRALPTQDRSINTIGNYLDGSENTDNNDTYITVPRSPTFNDVVVVVAP
jgi:type II secretory pathway pseudopilin PulG